MNLVLRTVTHLQELHGFDALFVFIAFVVCLFLKAHPNTRPPQTDSSREARESGGEVRAPPEVAPVRRAACKAAAAPGLGALGQNFSGDHPSCSKGSTS